MDAIYIPQLARAPEQTETIEVQEYLPDLETLTPVQGQIRVTHQGTYLEVSARAEAIMTLTCDRCLQQYNQRITIEATELIWLQEPVEEPTEEGIEREVALDDLIETLPPQGYFQPAQWLYEQLCLEIPHRKICDANCPGIQIQNNPPAAKPTLDRRWASLESFKENLSN
jgi:uncharacterized protein